MLGTLLYETVELTYNVTKLLYKGFTGTYYWYYGIEHLSEEMKKVKELEIEEKEKDKIINDLEDRINKLENLIEIEKENSIKEID
jgi:hypothetical protein